MQIFKLHFIVLGECQEEVVPKVAENVKNEGNMLCTISNGTDKLHKMEYSGNANKKYKVIVSDLLTIF